MGLKTGSYMKIWERKEPTENFVECRVSTSRKDKMSGEYITDFSGWVRLIGAAKDLAASNPSETRFKIGEFDVSNKYIKEKDKTYWNVAIFTLEKAEGNSKKSTPAPASTPKEESVVVDEDTLPF